MQIYAPSQIALAAVIHAASEAGQNVDSYVTDVLFATPDESDNQNLGVIIKAVKSKLTGRQGTVPYSNRIWTRLTEFGPLLWKVKLTLS